MQTYFGVKISKTYEQNGMAQTCAVAVVTTAGPGLQGLLPALFDERQRDRPDLHAFGSAAVFLTLRCSG